VILDPNNLRKDSNILIDQVDLIDQMEVSDDYTKLRSCVEGALAYYNTTGKIDNTLTQAVYTFVIGDFKKDEAKGRDEAFLKANGLDPKIHHQPCFSTVYQRPLYMEIYCLGNSVFKMKARDYEDVTCLMDCDDYRRAKELVDDKHVITEDYFGNKGSFDMTEFFNDLQVARRKSIETKIEQEINQEKEPVSRCEEIAKRENGDRYMDPDDKDYMFNSNGKGYAY